MKPIPRRRARSLARFAALAAVACAAPAAAQGTSTDPRVGLRAGWSDAGQAASNLRLVAHRDRPQGFVNPAQMGDFGVINTDMAFQGNTLYLGSYHGYQVWDISNPAAPRLRTTLECPGGQGDVSVYGKLLFLSVEETRGRVDCGEKGVADTVSAERFRGVRIFDISDVERPRQVAAVQTCRGSHTHTLVPDPRDAQTLYVYVSGTGPVRSPSELAGCSPLPPSQDPNSSFFRIDVIRVPLASPKDARIVASPRVFADSAGGAAGLWRGGNHGEGTQSTAQTNQCHDITVYPALNLAAGACAGNGILLDISNPENPVRIHDVSDPNFAYWHSATFTNDGSKVLFSDEWGGGTAPRCRTTDRPQWGADAIFTLADRRMTLAGYYKLPAPQTAQENCVAHNGSLIPVPGRDILVQAWYQGGISVFDFTDGANPKEIAFFDRGPMSATELVLSGFWSAYWYNGMIYGSEIGRGLDVFELTPSEQLSQNEIDAAKTVRFERLNPQSQPRLVWPASFVVARAYLDQLGRSGGIMGTRLTRIQRELDHAERLRGASRRTALGALAAQVEGEAQGSRDAGKVRMLAGTLRELAGR